MGRFFVEPETVRLELKNCESWIEIKKELNKAEYDTVIGAGIDSFTRGNDEETEYKIAASAVNIVKIKTWVLDWGFTTPDGKAVPVSMAAIENLTVDVADEVIAAIEEHQAKFEKEKKQQGSRSRPKAI